MNPPPNIGNLPTCAPVCAKAPPKVGLDNEMWAFLNWEGPKLPKGIPEDMGIDDTILLAKKLPANPIVIEGIPYENGFDAVWVYNGCWAIPPMGIEVEGLGYWAAEGIGCGAAIGIGCWAAVGIGCWATTRDPTISATEVTMDRMLCETFLVTIWSKENVLTILMFWSKSLKLFKFGNGSPTKGETGGAWTCMGVSYISTK